MAEREKPDGRSLAKLLKAAVEMIMPDLRQSMRLPRRAVVTAVKAAGGTYVCSVQAVLNDGRPDPKAPVIPDVEIPVMWAGPNRGVVCPPTVGEYCDIGFYDGDANSPFITNFRPNGQAPEAEEGAFMIQQGADVRFGFKPDGTFVVQAPKVAVTATDQVIIKSASRITLHAPEIELKGRVAATDGLHSLNDIATNANVAADGRIHAGGRIIHGVGNTNPHSHS
mgnify:CR=1 FL=1